ncbi:MAG: F0F1 ATP synthase subunit A [Pseudomonadota bacterium]
MASAEGGGIKIDPMAQFGIYPFFGDEIHWYSFTNSTLWMTIVVVVAAVIFVFGSQGRALVPTRLQSVGELAYEFIRNLVRDNAGEEGLKYFPYIFTIFVFVLFSNMLGLLPYSFTVTSHLAVTAVLAGSIFVTVTAIGFMKHGTHFFSFFVPQDAPLALKPILAMIEVISYFVRPITHSVRLAANMLAGHAVLKVFAGFVFPLFAGTVVGGVLPLGAMVGIYGLEVLVAVVQAYIFTILTCIYLNDALNMH